MRNVNPNKSVLVIAKNYQHFRNEILDADEWCAEREHKRQIMVGKTTYQYVGKADDLRGLSGHTIKLIAGWKERDDWKDLLDQIEAHNARSK